MEGFWIFDYRVELGNHLTIEGLPETHSDVVHDIAKFCIEVLIFQRPFEKQCFCFGIGHEAYLFVNHVGDDGGHLYTNVFGQFGYDFRDGMGLVSLYFSKTFLPSIFGAAFLVAMRIFLFFF